jgi:phosphate transport system substrate-binding protein
MVHAYRRLAAVTVMFGLIGVGVSSPGARAADSPPTRITVAGSGTNLASAHLLAEAFQRVRPDIGVEVPASIGSKGAIKAAAEGAIPLGLVSRGLESQETSLGLTVRIYAQSAIVFGAHAGVADEGVSLRDVVEIYQGKKTRWRDGREIVVLTRQPWDSSLEVMFREIPGFKDAYEESQRARRWMTLYTDQDMHRMIVRTPNAFGLADLGTVVTERLNIKVLKVDGVSPTADNVRAGRYPLVKPLGFAYRAAVLPPPAKAFMDFVVSPAGERVLRANGYLPAPD